MAKALDVNKQRPTDHSPTAPERGKDKKLQGKHAQVNQNSVEEGEPIHPDEAGEVTPERPTK
jgi:hypothetical protein